MDEKTKRSRKTKNYKDDSSDEDPYIEIDTFMKVCRRTSDWRQEDCDAMGIAGVNINTITDMFPSYKDDMGLPSEYKNLILPNLNDSNFGKVDIAEVLANTGNNRKVGSIINNAKDMYIMLKAKNYEETNVDAFTNSLLQYLGFNDYPLRLVPQMHLKAVFSKSKISSKVDICITNVEKNNYVLVIEDKTMSNVSLVDQWREPQVFGELFVCLHSTESHKLEQTYPITLRAIRIVSGYFTFYRVDVTAEYHKESSKGPTKVPLKVLRYPKFEMSESKTKIPSLSFYDPQERLEILKCLICLMV